MKERFINTHSVGELTKKLLYLMLFLVRLLIPGKKLDRHYLASHYLDALSEPIIPAESYIKDEAEEAVAIAKQIFETSAKLIKRV